MTSKLEELGKENLEYLEDLTDSNSKLDRIAVIRQSLNLPLFPPINTMQELQECEICGDCLNDHGDKLKSRGDLTKAQDIALCAKNIEKAFLRVEHQVTEMTGFHSVLTLLNTISHELGNILDSEPEKFDEV
jgi:hypothetical protein